MVFYINSVFLENHNREENGDCIEQVEQSPSETRKRGDYPTHKLSNPQNVVLADRCRLTLVRTHRSPDPRYSFGESAIGLRFPEPTTVPTHQEPIYQKENFLSNRNRPKIFLFFRPSTVHRKPGLCHRYKPPLAWSLLFPFSCQHREVL